MTSTVAPKRHYLHRWGKLVLVQRAPLVEWRTCVKCGKSQRIVNLKPLSIGYCEVPSNARDT